MTVDQLRPAIGEDYRHRDPGRVFTLECVAGPHVILRASNGRTKLVDEREFFGEWIHAKAKGG